MKTKLSCLLVALVALVAAPLRAESVSDIQGIKDACAAGVLLDRSGISYEVVVAGNEAGCIYSVDGVKYLYTPAGSAKINPEQLGNVTLQKVPRSEVFAIAGDHRRIDNGCLVFATSSFAGYKHDHHIVWAGIIAARVININPYGASGGGECFGGTTGHAITAFENDKREVFVQEDGEEPHKVDHLTELAQSGNTSWHDSSTLAYCLHHIQGFTSFKGEYGRPL